MKKALLLILVALIFGACTNRQNTFDATGTFEADEVMVSARQSGQILSLKLQEGDKLMQNQFIGNIDISAFTLQKEQVKATIGSLQEKLNSADPQVAVFKKQLAVQESQLNYLATEQKRIENLLKADAATRKQLDDINAKKEEAQKQSIVIQQQMMLAKANVQTQNKTILSQQPVLEKSIDQIKDQIQKGEIINPVKGTVLTQYAFPGEMASPGKALYKIASLDTLMLRAYVTGSQLPTIKLGQVVTVKIDDGKSGFRSYKGTLSWIAAAAEFTPKTIQTKDERANLVFAIKVRVPNDGYLKIGMYGEINF